MAEVIKVIVTTTIQIITEDEEKKQEKTIKITIKDPKEWEEESYRVGCSVSKEVAKQVLKALDDELFEEHPEDWKSVSYRRRTRVTRFGSFKVKRRLYKDKEGNSHFCLDEYLN